MAAATRGLSTADITLIRETLASGRKPKVVFTESAGQVAGRIGQVIDLTDPKSSDDWIVVRFGRDELPFAPADVAIPSKATPAKATATAKRAQPPEPPPLRLTEPPKPESPKPESPRTVPAKTAPARAEAPRTRPATLPQPREEQPMAAANAASNGAGTPVPMNGATRPAKAPKVKPLPSLTVTLAYTDREWTIAAQQGSKTLAKPYVIKPTEALQMVALIDMPGVHEAVQAIIEAERAEAETRALRLREELAEIESRLAELTSKG